MSTVQYKCDTCNREIDVLEKRNGLTHFSKCIITEGCKGKLYKTKRNPYSIRENFPQPSTLDLTNYVPRRAFYEFKKNAPEDTWTIVHEMGVAPSVTVYGFEETTGVPVIIPEENYSINIIDETELTLTFDEPIVGIAHLVARSSRKVDPTTVENIDQYRLITPNDTMTLAFLGKINFRDPSDVFYPGSDESIILSIVLEEPGSEPVFCNEVFDAHNEKDSPWSDWEAIISRKRRNYSIRSKHLKDFAVLADLYDSELSKIPNGTRLRITQVAYGSRPFSDIGVRDILMLLANEPYSNRDKDLENVIDVGRITGSNVNSTYVFIDGSFYLLSEQVEPIYPITEKANLLLQP